MKIKVTSRKEVVIGDQDKNHILNLLEKTDEQVTPRAWDLIELNGVGASGKPARFNVVCLVPELEKTAEGMENVLFKDFLRVVSRAHGLKPCPMEVGIQFFLKSGVAVEDYTVVVLEGEDRSHHLAIEPIDGKHYLDVHHYGRGHHIENGRPMLFVEEEVAA